MPTLADAYRALFRTEPPPLSNPRFKARWCSRLSELCELEETDRWTPGTPWDERHRIYAHLLVAIVYHYWNGWKKGRPADPSAEYPWNDVPHVADRYLNGDYYGHNIAALAVDAKGYVLDFDFNHMELFNASTEHAEGRLVRRLYALAQVADSWGTAPGTPSDTAGSARRGLARGQIGNDDADGSEDKKYTTLDEVTVYTTLEPCAQCAGVMALAKIKSVVYLQTDPTMYFISRILRNLTPDDLRAPVPISGAEIDFKAFARLDAAYGDFAQRVVNEPFHKPRRGQPGNPDARPSITSFLCTRDARTIFDEFRELPSVEKLESPGWAPFDTALNNAQALTEALDFFDYAAKAGRRGTPHNL